MAFLIKIEGGKPCKPKPVIGASKKRNALLFTKTARVKAVFKANVRRAKKN